MLLFWLAVWQLAALWLNSGLLLAGPVEVAGQLLNLLPTGAFWQRVAFSALRILRGFFLALVCG